jgi:hypothetical protein
MEFNPNCTYMLQSAMAEGNVYHKDCQHLFLFRLTTTCFNLFDRHQVIRIHVLSSLNCFNIDPYFVIL